MAISPVSVPSFHYLLAFGRCFLMIEGHQSVIGADRTLIWGAGRWNQRGLCGIRSFYSTHQQDWNVLMGPPFSLATTSEISKFVVKNGAHPDSHMAVKPFWQSIRVGSHNLTKLPWASYIKSTTFFSPSLFTYSSGPLFPFDPQPISSCCPRCDLNRLWVGVFCSTLRPNCCLQ